MILIEYESIILLRIATNEKTLKNILNHFILMASGYTFDLPRDPRDHRRDDRGYDKMLLFGYSIGGSDYILKDLYISAFKKVRVYFEAINRLNSLSFTRAIVRPNLIEWKVTGLPEYTREEGIYVMVHNAARRMDRYINEQEAIKRAKDVREHKIPVEYCDHRDAVEKEGILVIALALVAMSSPIYRQTVGVRQLAAQEILRYAFRILKNYQDRLCREYILDLLSDLLSVITVDTYLWYPYHLSKLLLTYGGELTFAVAVEPLRDLIKNIEEHYQSPRDLICALNNYAHLYRKIIKDIFTEIAPSHIYESDLIGFINAFHREYRNKILSSLQIYSKAETLFGRLTYIVSSINSGLKGQSYENREGGIPIHIITLTEQTGPIYLDIIEKITSSQIRKLILIYTPQTYFNYLYITHNLVVRENRVIIKNLEDLCKESGHNDIDIYPIVIPSTEGMLIRAIAKGIRKRLKSCINDNKKIKVKAFLQGLSMISVPLYIELSKVANRDDLIFI